MANWCYNDITITGDLTEVRPLIKLLEEEGKGGVGWLPEEVAEEMNKREFLSERYLFNSQVYEDTKTTIGLSVETKWAPPIEEVVLMQKMCKGSKWIIDYREYGCGVHGRTYISDDDVTDFELDEKDIARFTYDDNCRIFFDGEEVEGEDEIINGMIDDKDTILQEVLFKRVSNKRP